MYQLSDRTATFSDSVIRRMTRISNKFNAVNLSQGFPDFDPPAELLAAFSVIGCRGIFSTHLHELAARVDEISAKGREHGGVGIDSIVADITDGKRSFKIIRRRPDGKSYAKDITDKYGLSFDRVIDKLKK